MLRILSQTRASILFYLICVCVGEAKQLNDNSLIINNTDLVHKVQLTGRVMPLEIIDITSPTNAKIANIMVQPGDKITTGQLILELESDQLDIDIRNAQEMYIKAQIDYNKKKLWQNSDDVFQATQTNLKNKLNFQRSNEIYRQNVSLFKQGIISQNELDQSQLSYQDAQLNLELSERHLKQVINQGNETQLNLLELSLSNAKAKLEILEKIKQKLAIPAPIDGVILRANKSDNGDNKSMKFLSIGQNVSSGEHLLAIGNLNGLTINVLAGEQIIQHVQLKQKVDITIPALNTNNKLEGVISEIDAQPKDPENSNAPPKYSIKIVAENSNSNIFLGMTTKINFDLIEKHNAILIPFTSISYDDNNQAYVKILKDKEKVVSHQVTLGKTTSDKIEVLAGLKIGDIIQTSAST